MSAAEARPAPLLSIISSAYNEAENLPLLHHAICEALDPARIPWELIVVDDHSGDRTFEVLSAVAAKDPRVQGVRLSRNAGSHTAALCALARARGDCIVQIAADLQHPPQLIPELWKRWRAGAQVIWVARASRPGDKRSTVFFSRLYYFIMRHIVGLKDMAPAGADFFAIDRKVAAALLECGERNVSLNALITWLGFRQETMHYDRPARIHGRSGWTLEKKLKLVIDSVTSFTYLPIRFMSYVGVAWAFLGSLYAVDIVWNRLAVHSVQGWSSLMVVVLIGGGIQMIMLGVLGEYLWRALDESRHRPRYFVEAATPSAEARVESTGSSGPAITGVTQG